MAEDLFEKLLGKGWEHIGSFSPCFSVMGRNGQVCVVNSVSHCFILEPSNIPPKIQSEEIESENLGSEDNVGI